MGLVAVSHPNGDPVIILGDPVTANNRLPLIELEGELRIISDTSSTGLGTCCLNGGISVTVVLST